MIQKQVIPVPFVAGTQTKTDPKLLESPSLARLENGRLTKPGRISKRPGNLALTTETIDAVTIENAEAVGLFKDELLVFEKEKIYSYSEQAAKFVDKGTVSSCVTSLDPITSNSLTQDNVDFDTNNNLTVYAWQISNNTLSSNRDIYASVFDETSKSFIKSEIPLTSGGDFVKPLVQKMGQYLYVFYVNVGTPNIRYRRLALDAPTTFESEQVLASSTLGVTDYLYDIDAVDSNRCAIVYDNGTRICFGIFDGSGVSPSFSPDTSTIGDRASPCLSVKVEPTTLSSWVTYYRQGTQQLRYFIFSSTQTIVLTTTTIGSTNFPYVEAIAGEFDSSSTLRLFYQCAAQETRTFAPADVNTGTSTITMIGHKLCDGQKIRVSTTTTLPAPLAAVTDYYVVYITDNTFRLATSLVNALRATTITITTQGTGTHTLTEQNERNTTYVWNRDVRSNTITSAGVSGTASILANQTGLASKAFRYSDETYFMGWFKRTSQFGYFIFKQDGSIVGKSLFDRAEEKFLGGTSFDLPVKVKELDGKFIWSAVYKSQFFGELEPGAVVVPTTIYSATRVEIDFDSVEKYFNEEPSNQAAISGSYVSSYDGALSTESGFHLFPDSLRSAPLGSGGAIDAGTYQYKFVYEWKDLQGNVWQSIDSGAQTVVAGATDTIYFLVPTLCHTKKTAAASPVKIVMYSTQTGGTLFFRINGASQRLAGTTTFTTPAAVINSTSVGWTILAIGTEPTGSEQGLYTDSGELENVPPPPASFISRSKNRVYVLNSEDPLEVWYSKFNYGNNAIAFNDSLTKRLSGFGKIRCVQPMDDKVVLFTPTSVHYFSGDGPLDTGEQDTFTDIEFVTSDTGCDNPNSLVTFPNGILFQSPKGYYKLGRDLSVTYIGAPVEDFNANVCSSATLLADQNLVIFTCKDGAPSLVYDYYTDQWGTDTNQNANDSVSWKKQFVHARQSGGDIYVQTPNVWSDNGTTYPLKLETPWIKVQNIQNFQRVRKLLLLGGFKSDHKLKVSIAYDFQDGFVDIVTWDAGAAINTEALGDEVLLGDDDLLGGQADDVYQCSLHIPRQKCESIKFLIEDISDGDLLESYNISHMALEVGIKDGTYKLRSEKTAGS